MSGIATALEITDRMTSPLNRITASLYSTINGFKKIDKVSDDAFNTKPINAASQELYIVDQRVQDLERQLISANEKFEKMGNTTKQNSSAVDKLNNKFKSVLGTIMSMATAYAGINFAKNAINAANSQIEAETKLTTIMQQRMNATDAEINSVKKLASEQQKLGVVGDEVQLAGIQQLATFMKNTDALKSLVPAMNNLAVQQDGVAVTGDSMTNIANMMGKAMQGQASALTRVGITMTEAEEAALKMGTEEERAAVLAQIITNNVGEMNKAIADTPQGKIQQLSNTFGDLMEQVGMGLYPAIQALSDAITNNMPAIQTVMNGIGAAISVIINIIAEAINLMAELGTFISDNWSIIEPIFLGATVAIGGFVVAMGAAKAITAATAIVQGVWTAATNIATMAQYTFNGALLACPLTWIIGIIMAVIAGIYGIVQAINSVTGSVMSGTGVIMGAITVAAAAIWNTIAGLINFIISIGVELYNLIASFANAFANIFNDPVGAIIRLFTGMFDFILGIVEGAAGMIDFVLGTDYAAGIANFRKDVASAVDDIIGPQKEVMAKVNKEDVMLDNWDYESAWQSGYSIGEGIDNAVGDMFNPSSFDTGWQMGGSGGSSLAGMAEDMNATADNTKAVADSVNISNENLKYMKDIAEQEAINRFTTAEIKVDMTNNNTVNSGMDIDGMISHLSTGVSNAMAELAQGVHA